jgi:hypothetical protein
MVAQHMHRQTEEVTKNEEANRRHMSATIRLTAAFGAALVHFAAANSGSALRQKKVRLPARPIPKSRSATIVPYSGPASAYGIIGKTEEAYFKMINENGGIIGRKVKFISYDDAYSPPKAVEQVRKLVESDEVLVVFNALGTPSNTAIQEISEHQEGAATVRRHRRHQVERPDALFRGPSDGCRAIRAKARIYANS